MSTDPASTSIDRVRAALTHLGIDPDDVAQVVMDTKAIVVTRYARNHDGHFYTDPDGRTATDSSVIEITWRAPDAEGT